MRTAVIRSAPTRSSGTAMAAVHTSLAGMGGGLPVKILNINLEENDGVWSAVAIVEIEDPDLEEDKEGGEGKGSGGRARGRGRDDTLEAEYAMLTLPKEIAPEDFVPKIPPLDMEPLNDNEREKPEPEPELADDLLKDEQFSQNMEVLAKQLLNDFNGNEAELADTLVPQQNMNKYDDDMDPALRPVFHEEGPVPTPE